MDMDDRAQKLVAAGRAVLPKLGELLGGQAKSVESELKEALDAATNSWNTEAIRDILFRYPETQRYLEDAVPEAKSPRPFEGGHNSKFQGNPRQEH